MIESILQHLTGFSAANVFNPWAQNDTLDAYPHGAAMRVDRLREHFDCEARFLLVGEAPGYQGCHFSGVPFTNERLLLEGKIPRIKVNLRITKREVPWSEPSATVVWKTLHELGIANVTVMWNAFAWHPHKPGEPLTNRAPTKEELLSGSRALRGVVHHFRDRNHYLNIIAVGRVAQNALKLLGVDIGCAVRHPSMGGAKQFRAGMEKVVENL